jgi:CheY-like chemotaxis protein
MNKRVLLADDDESVRKMVGRVLETAGYHVLRASTGNEAVAKFRAGQPHLVLLDLKMPDQEGWEAFEQLSRHDPLVPVIVITAWPNQYDEAVQRGIDALMEKPLDIPLLLQTIQKLLDEPEHKRTERLTDRSFITAYLGNIPTAA